MAIIRHMIYGIYRMFFPVRSKGRSNEVEIRSRCHGRLRIDVIGENNHVIIDKDVYMLNVNISITGNNNIVNISQKSRLYDLKLCVLGDNNKFYFGVDSGVREADILVMEGRKVIIGDDSMLSYGIHIRTSDSHRIVDLGTGERINPACDVIVGEHCWIAQNVTLLKGAEIGNYSIVGFGAICSKVFPSHCIVAGIPGRVIKENIRWERT